MKPVIWIVALVVVVGPATHADIILFEHECVTPVTGRIGDIEFKAPFIITAVGDTDDREREGTAWLIAHLAATIDIHGLGTFDFLTPTMTFLQEQTNGVGFARVEGNQGRDLFDGPRHPDFEFWDMTTSIGPLSGNDGIVTQWDRDPLIETTGGILFIEEQFDLRVVFTATVIPTPAAVWAFGLLWVFPRRRREIRGHRSTRL